MPKEASNHFGEKLFPFVKAVTFSNPDLPFEEMNDIPNEIRNAIICSHGKLAPNYEYIMEIRRVNEKLSQNQNDYMQKIHDFQRKPSSIRRGMSFATLVISGNLFATRFFNNCVEILTRNDMNFRVIEWEVGNTSLKNN